jgi:hypothetical protein
MTCCCHVYDSDQSIMPSDRLLLLGTWCQTGSANYPTAWKFGSDAKDDKQKSENYVISMEEIESWSEYWARKVTKDSSRTLLCDILLTFTSRDGVHQWNLPGRETSLHFETVNYVLYALKYEIRVATTKLTLWAIHVVA